jgi:phage terminase large subunit-like protein
LRRCNQGGPEDERSDEIGIVVAGVDFTGNAVVLDDLSGRMAPAEWARVACDGYKECEARRIALNIAKLPELLRHIDPRQMR